MSATAQAPNSSFRPISLPEEGVAEGPMVPAAGASSLPLPPRRRSLAAATALVLGGALVVGAAVLAPRFISPHASDVLTATLPAPVRLSHSAPSAPTVRTPELQLTAPAKPVGSVTDAIAAITDPLAPTLMVSAMPVPVAPVAEMAPAPSGAPVAVGDAAPARTANPIDTVLSLVPAATTPQQELQILGLVTQIATQMRDMTTDNQALREQVSVLSRSLDNRLSDLERRVNFREAQEAVASTQSRPTRPAEVTFSVPVPPSASVQSSGWRVQGGSPRMAVLAPTGSGPIKVVRVGDTIDDRYGAVKSIAQQGRDWVVTAERGTIRGGE